MRGTETQRQFVVLAAIFRFDQFHRRTIAEFRQVGNVAYRFVEQDSDTGLLLRLRLPCEGDFLIGKCARAQLSNCHTIDHHPALLDVAVGFAARAKALFGHQFGDADFFHLTKNLFRHRLTQINADEKPASSFWRKPESSALTGPKGLTSDASHRVTTWIPACAGMTVVVIRVL